MSFTRATLGGCCLCLGLLLSIAPAYAASEYAGIGGGELHSVLPVDGGRATVAVAAFKLQRLPVTNGEFLHFLRSNPQWQRGRAASGMADEHYLQSWAGPTQLGDSLQASQPVTEVSWFAARAYCESRHARLPRWTEWELAAAADEHRADARQNPEWQNRILGWYSQPATAHPGPVGRGSPNYYGVSDLHGLIWEWVEDFSGLFISPDNRLQGDPEQLKYCGSGALSVEDRENYPTMMRLAMLSSLKARSTILSVGFRCAWDPQASAHENITLQTQSGRYISAMTPAAGPRLVSMFYASCPMACPLTIDTLKAVERQLSDPERSRLKIMMVSFDSQRDTPAALRALARERRLDLSRWTLARASAKDVRKLAALLDIPYRPLANGGFNHASRLVLLDGEGTVMARSDRFGVPDPDFIRAIRTALTARASR